MIAMLPNSRDVKQAVLGDCGVLQGACPGTLLVDMSSIAPRAAQDDHGGIIQYNESLARVAVRSR